MSIVRVVKDTNYTTINNTVLNDTRLTWKAKGLAAYLLSKPDNWQIVREHLEKQSTDGITVVRTALKELETFGYLVRTRRRGDDGRFSWEHVLHETPLVENPPVENLSVENPPVENLALVNTDVVSTDLTNTDVGGAGRARAAQPPKTQTSPPPAAAHPVDLALPNPPTEAEMAETTVSVRAVKYKRSAYAKGPYLKGAKLTEGYIAPGAGINAVQVYHERNCADDLKLQLTDPQQDDLVAAVQDLSKWRRVVVAWNQAGYNPKNLAGHLDWYCNGIPNEKGTHHGATNNSHRPSNGKSGSGPLPEPVKQDWVFIVGQKHEPNPNEPY